LEARREAEALAIKRVLRVPVISNQAVDTIAAEDVLDVVVGGVDDVVARPGVYRGADRSAPAAASKSF
jgi:hypothetical protein